MGVGLDGPTELLLVEILNFTLHLLDVVVKSDVVLGTTTPRDRLRGLLVRHGHTTPLLATFLVVRHYGFKSSILPLGGRKALILWPCYLSTRVRGSYGKWVRADCVVPLCTVLGYRVAGWLAGGAILESILRCHRSTTAHDDLINGYET